MRAAPGSSVYRNWRYWYELDNVTNLYDSRSMESVIMRVVCAFNRYRDRGGEDSVFESEVALLKSHGHSVTRLEFFNSDIQDDPSLLQSARLAVSTVWSRQGAAKVNSVVRRANADIIHFTNTFPLISPAAYSAAKAAGAAVVQTVHNYRMLCPTATFYRDNHVCEDCLGRTIPWPGVLHACYHDSRAETAVVAAMLTTHRMRKTWQRDVDAYVTPTEFTRNKLIQGDFPANRIFVKPNFLDPTPVVKSTDGDYCLFVGRLSKEKGVETLVKVWTETSLELPLRLAGAGPLDELVTTSANTYDAIKALGWLPRTSILKQMRNARILIFPSVWYEGLPVTIVEAFACGLPVIASRLGAMPEIIEHGRTGLLFDPDNGDDLISKVKWALAHPEELRRIGAAARREFEMKYTAERNHAILMGIYQQALERNQNT